MNTRNRDSGLQFFKNLKILPLKSQCIFHPSIFHRQKQRLNESISEIHNMSINTRFSSDLHSPIANLITFQKGPLYSLITFLLA